MERINERNISFNLIEKKNLVILDSSFEDHSHYTKNLLLSILEEYKKKHQKRCVFHVMNQKLEDGENIFYKNFCWKLYKNITPPKYEKNLYNFTYLCGCPRIDKLHMLSALFDNNLLGEETLWSCGSIDKKLINQIKRKINLPKSPKILDYDKSIKGKRECWSEIQLHFFKRSRFSLVQETEMTNRSNRYTEKTYKCFWMKHPFILAGNYQTLKLLKNDGFKTFHPYIDESYDDIEDRDERIKEIIKQLKILNKKREDEWQLFFENINPILNYNYKHAQNMSLYDR